MMCRKLVIKNGVINNLRLWDVEIPEEYELDYPTLEARRRVKDITAILIQMIQQLKVKNCVWFKSTL